MAVLFVNPNQNILQGITVPTEVSNFYRPRKSNGAGFCSKVRQTLIPFKIIGCEGCPGFCLISHLPTTSRIYQINFVSCAVPQKITVVRHLCSMKINKLIDHKILEQPSPEKMGRYLRCIANIEQ